MVFMLVFLMCLEDFACLEIEFVESLTLFISELSFWRCELLKNDGSIKSRKKQIFLQKNLLNETHLPLIKHEKLTNFANFNLGI